MGSDERVTIGLVSITPSTGDLVYDEFVGKCHSLSRRGSTTVSKVFVDTHMRTELEVSMLDLIVYS